MREGKKKAGWFAVLWISVLLSLAVLAGCSSAKTDASTPDGALMGMIQTAKEGGVFLLPHLSGDPTASSLDEQVSQEQNTKLYRAMFSKIDVSVEKVETVDENTAKVTVKGKTGDLPTLLKRVGSQFQASFQQWTLKNGEKLLQMTNEEMQLQVTDIMIDLLDSQAKEIPSIEINAEVTMAKAADGKWKAALGSEDAVAQILCGADSQTMITAWNSMLANL